MSTRQNNYTVRFNKITFKLYIHSQIQPGDRVFFMEEEKVRTGTIVSTETIEVGRTSKLP